MADEANSAEHGEAEAGKQMVPLERLNEVLAKVRNLEARVNAPQPQAETKPEKIWSRTELADAVAKGVITQEASDEYRDLQLLKQAERTADTKATERARQEAAATAIKAYEDVYPELADDQSERFKLVAVEYQQLLQLGSPATGATMLAATKAALGPLKLAGKIGVHARRSIPEGGSGSAGANADDGEGKMSPRQVAYYEKQVAQGRIKNMKEAGEQWAKYQARGARA